MLRHLIRRAAIVGAAASLATVGALFAISASAGAKTTEKSFEDVGEHDYVVPAGICWVTIEAFGAEGGGAIDESNPVIPGGLGGGAEARIAVTPGETLEVNVGGAGADGVEHVAGEGGDNGGADGGAGGDPDVGNAGGGGGGASDVRQGGTGLDARVVVAGGGGGAGGGTDPPFQAGDGGDGGGEEGEDGQAAVEADPFVPTGGGESGNESEGGDGGAGAPATFNGDDGEFGEGGDGGGATTDNVDGGGGGGGGWYGGGGGGGGFDDAGLGDASGSGGGGGSGFGPDGVEFDTGVHAGDGEVTISYDPVKDVCAAEIEAIEVEPTFTG
jgi:hypothetical protein